MSKMIAMTAREYTNDQGEKKTYWYEIGAAWPTKSGDGFNVQLSAFPVNGQLSLFPPKAKPETVAEV